MTVYAANLSAESYDFVLSHVGAIQFDNNLTGPSGKTIQITSSGGSIETKTNGKVTGSSLLLNAKDSISFDSNTAQPFATQVSTLAVVITNTNGYGVNIRNTGDLIIGSVSGTDGITSYGGITVTASSPLRVSKAIRENAGGNINLTAGNDNSQLGDNLTVEADVVITCSAGASCDGKITGNAGDNISTNSGTQVSAPGGVDFNGGLDGLADNGGGATTVSGTVEATNNGAAINISGTAGVNLTNGSLIKTNNGNVTLTAANGTVTRNGTIIRGTGSLGIFEGPPITTGSTTTTVITTVATTTVLTGAGVGSITGAASGSTSGAAGTTATAGFTTGILTVTSGQPVSLLEAIALGAAVNLQLPEGAGATFITGVDATVTLTASGEVVLPAELPAGFELLDSLEIAMDTADGVTEEELGEILISFGLPADTPIEELVILQFIEGEGWVEVALEESFNGQIEGLTETGGVFVLAQGGSSAQATGNGSAQATLSGNTNEPVTLELDQGAQVSVTGGAGDAVAAVSQGQDSLPGDLPPGAGFINGLSVDVTQAGQGVSILPNGEGVEVSFDLPEGVSPEDITILYWLDVLNGGQGGWQTLTPEITPDGRVTIQTFFDGVFVLAEL